MNATGSNLFCPKNIGSAEPLAMPGMEQTQKGIAKIKGKNQWWVDNHQRHTESRLTGPTHMVTASSCISSMTLRRNRWGNA
jgi:hypothetical protein